MQHENNLRLLSQSIFTFTHTRAHTHTHINTSRGYMYVVFMIMCYIRYEHIRSAFLILFLHIVLRTRYFWKATLKQEYGTLQGRKKINFRPIVHIQQFDKQWQGGPIKLRTYVSKYNFVPIVSHFVTAMYDIHFRNI